MLDRMTNQDQTHHMNFYSTICSAKASHAPIWLPVQMRACLANKLHTRGLEEFLNQ